MSRMKDLALATSLCLLLAVPANASLELVTRRDPSFPPSDAAGASGDASISADGRYAAFDSAALNLIAGQEDGNKPWEGDVFLRDMLAGTTVLVSRSASSPNRTGNGHSYTPVISADGRYVAFGSNSTDLVPGQTDGNLGSDIFLYDRVTGTTALVSHSSTSASQAAVQGSSAWAISADGGFVLFTSGANDLVAGQVNNGGPNTFLYDRGTGTVALVSHIPGSPATTGNGASPSFFGIPPVLSADGRFVAFNSTATNLVSGVTDTNSTPDAFLYDRTTGLVTLLSRSALTPTDTANNDSSPDSISADGDLITLTSHAGDLVSGQSGPLPTTPNVFLYQRSTGSMRLVSRSSSSATTTGFGFSGTSRISGDGSRIAFLSTATDMIPGGTSISSSQAFLYDVPTGAMTLVSRSLSSATTGGNDAASLPRINADGSRVAFASAATDLLAGQFPSSFLLPVPCVFLYSASSGSLTLVSRSAANPVDGVGTQGSLALSGEGDEVIFSTRSGALDTDGTDASKTTDVFLYSVPADSIATFSVRDPDLPSITSAGFSQPSKISADGRFLAFVSDGDQLSPGQVNVDDEDPFGLTQLGFVFLHDRLLGTNTLVSHAAGSPSQPANNPALDASVSAAGNYVLFESSATDLLSGAADANDVEDLFLWQRTTGTTTLVSHAAGSPGTAADQGGHDGSLSADGRYLAFLSRSSDLVPGFSSGSGPLDDAFLFDWTTGTISLITSAAGSPTQGSPGTESVRISAGGRYVVFASYADNLIAGQQDVFSADVFVWDRVTGTTELISHAAGSTTATAQGDSVFASISADGRYVAFHSDAPDLVAGFTPGASSFNAYVHDRLTGITQLISRTSASATTGAGGQAPTISDDGRYVSFQSSGTGLVPGQVGPASPLGQIYVFDRVSGTMTLVSHAAGTLVTASNGYTSQPRISADGSFVSFVSESTNLIPGQAGPAGLTNAFMYDRVAGTTRLASGAGGSATQAGNNSSGLPLLSANGRVAAFSSRASNLVADDYLGTQDIFLSTVPPAGTDFHTAVPCRVLDTRSGAAPVSGTPRLVTVAGICGIPAAARAVAVNVTAVDPTGNGNVAAYPGYLESTGTSTVSFQAGKVRASSAILPLALNGTGTLSLNPSVAGGGNVHLILDVSGWFE
jgi:Tol biopolymer transport system component